METQIGPLGYSITLKSIPPHFLENIRTDLNVKPLENPHFGTGDSTTFPVYRISKSKIYLPRYYGITNYKKTKNVLEDGEPINLTFHGSLRDIQQQTIDATLKTYEEYGGGLVSLDTGLGKTVVALKLIELMKVKTLIIVHAEFLLEQWVSRIKQFLPDARIGIIRQNKCETENVDISVGMIQTIINRDYPKDFFKSYAHTVVDECFPYDQHVFTSIGSKRIGQLYNLWKNKKDLPLILSFNETTKTFEYKKMTHAWEKENKTNLLEIKTHASLFRCTPNHKILTPNGYVEAANLKPGNLLSCELIVVSVNEIPACDYVYDIEVEDNHNFQLYNGPIVHNCHHVLAKSFSSIFYKVQTKYMLGLSATPERKDGLSKVIYWFLGPQIITIKRETGKPSIQFHLMDTANYIEKFNKLGKVNNPQMITDLTKQETRNEYIISLIKENVSIGRKILVLSDRRDHCDYLNNQLKLASISCGVYLGGMKTKDRETSVNCSVILGTYQASGEGFDVPELDTLILASPKSDVEQAVGRILRQKNANEPIVHDIVDSFSIFKGQYYKRRKFYKTNEFKIK